MSNTITANMKRTSIVSGGALLVALVVFFLTRVPLPAEEFWAPYVQGLNRASLLITIFGFVWLALSLGHVFSQVFDLDRPMDASEFTATLAIVVVVTGVLLAILVPKVPMTPPSRLPSDPKQRAEVIRTENNFRGLVIAGLLASGVALASVPCRRFLSK